MFPLILILVSILSGLAVAMGAHSDWGQFHHGLAVIVAARRFLWPLVLLGVVVSIVLLALVISGRRRAWWLLGLAPLLLLFIYRFGMNPMGQFACVENPAMIHAAKLHDDNPSELQISREEAPTAILHSDDPIIGVVHKSIPYAFPLSSLYADPVVVEADSEGQFALLWSPYANRAVVVSVDRDMKARDLEIVSMPANATLIYSSRFGQFVNALTGMTVDQKIPTGFRSHLPTEKMTWGQWQALHPDTLVMALPHAVPEFASRPLPPRYPLPASASYASAAAETHAASAPAATQPSLQSLVSASPTHAVPQSALASPAPTASHPSLKADTLITFISATQLSERPIAIISTHIEGRPLNIHVGSSELLIFRDPSSGRARVFERSVKEPGTNDELHPAFHRRLSRAQSAGDDSDKHPTAFLVDADTASLWTADGKAIDGPCKGQQLREVHDVDADLYWGVMKACYKNLELTDPPPAADASDKMTSGDGSAPVTPPRRRAHHPR